jgi:transposase-like protein
MLTFGSMSYEKLDQSAIMRQHIASCIESGKTVDHYCTEHDINPSSYYYWRKKLFAQQPGKFVSIAPAVSNAPLTIVFTSGHRIVFETLPSVEYVKQLVG